MLNNYSERKNKSMKLAVRLEKTALKITNNTVNYLSQYDLTFNQFKVLEVLHHRGDLNIGSITKLTMSTPGNITVVVRNLKRDGWIESIKDPNDNRASILTIKQKGKNIIEEIFPNHVDNLENHFNELEEKELDVLLELLNKVYKTN